MEYFSQIAIFILGCTAVFLVSSKEPYLRKWGYISGFISQPFWFYTAYHNQQWGIFLMAFWYTINWGRGIYNTWEDK